MRDPYLEHVLAIAGLGPASYAGALAGQEGERLAPPPFSPQQLALSVPGYPPPFSPQPPTRPLPCFDWTTVVFASALAGLLGYLVGRK